MPKLHIRRRRLAQFAALGAAVLSIFVVGAAVRGQSEARRQSPCEIRVFEGSRFVVCRYLRGINDIQLAWRGVDGPLGGFDALEAVLGRARSRLRFAMNAGMFDRAQSPVGLLILSGVIQHPAETGSGSGNFYLLPNGVFSVDADGKVHIEETERFLARGAAPMWATQSGPLLVENGVINPKIAPDGASRLVRNGVGAPNADEADFVISEGPVSFGRMARFFRDALHCPDALYLDGTVSSLWAPSLKLRDPAQGLGPLVVVTAKAKR